MASGVAWLRAHNTGELFRRLAHIAPFQQRIATRNLRLDARLLIHYKLRIFAPPLSQGC
jgi:hypothetical protein